MNETSQFFASHTAPVLFLAIFAEQIGVPIPAAPLLVAAGALAAQGALSPLLAIAVTITACVLPDFIWFYVGRRGGKSFMRFVRRLPLSDSSSFERAERLFTKYGMTAVVAAKFIPGLSVLIPPLAGALKIDFNKFLRFDLFGSFLYGIFYLHLGYLFNDEVNSLLDLSGQFGAGAVGAAVALILIFLAYKFAQRRKETGPASGVASNAAAAVSAT